MNLREAFATALRVARISRSVTQEDFSAVSSRVYLSALERCQKSPTLDKLDQLAEVLEIHPVSLVLLTYSLKGGDRDALLKRITQEVRTLSAAAREIGPGTRIQPRPPRRKS